MWLAWQLQVSTLTIISNRNQEAPYFVRKHLGGIQKEERTNRIKVQYPLDEDVGILFSPSKSYGESMKRAIKSLYKKLAKAGLLELFQEQMDKTLADGHIEFLRDQQAELALLRNQKSPPLRR